MMRYGRNYWPYVYLATLLTLFVAVIYVTTSGRTPPFFMRPKMTSLSPRLQPLFEKTKTVCVGQFIMEVPATATVVYGPAEVTDPIEFFPGEGERVADHVAIELKEVEKDRIYLDPRDAADFVMFGKVIDGAMPGQKLVFGSKDQASYTVTSFIPIGKDMYVQSGAATSKTLNEDIAELNEVAKRLRLRSENEIPTEVGTCIEGGFVSMQPVYEKVTIGVRLKEFPDVHFSVVVHKNQDYLVDSSDLEQRLERTKKDTPHGFGSWYSRIKFLRRGRRQLGVWKGYEALTRLPPKEAGTEAHEFHFHSLGALYDPLQPELDLQLDTGVKDNRTSAIKPSITDDEAIDLWEMLSSSIRVRPTVPKADSAPPKVPLGECHVTGRTCPQTGWWQSIDHDAVEDKRRQFFKKGDKLPKAWAHRQLNLWEKVKGEEALFQSATVWQLAAYDDEGPKGKQDDASASDPDNVGNPPEGG